MKRVLLALVFLATASLGAGCSSTEDGLGASSSSGANGQDSGADSEAATPDPNGGRDDTIPSCFAACQNSGFQCLAKGASNSDISVVELTPRDTGCAGTWTTSAGVTSAIALNCGAKKICTGAKDTDPTDCVSGTYSAFNFAFTPVGSAETICTRN